MKTKGQPIIGYRTMTGAQRYNARMERIWNNCQEAKTRFNLSSRTESGQSGKVYDHPFNPKLDDPTECKECYDFEDMYESSVIKRDDDDGLEMHDDSCGECGHPYKRGDETHYPECSRII